MIKRVSERILIVYLKTGGGHISAARALASALEERPGTQAVLCNPIQDAQRFTRFCVVKSYNYMASKGRFLWPAFYLASAWSPLLTLSEFLFSRSVYRQIAHAVYEHQITRIVVVHFMCRRPVRMALQRIGANHIPVIQVVTDPYTAHRAWFHRMRYQCVVFSSRVYNFATHVCGVDAHRIVRFPVVLRKQFQTPLDAGTIVDLKKRFGFDPEKRMVLVAAGGEGLSNGSRVLEALVYSDADYEIAVVCGNSTSFQAEAARIARKNPNRRVAVYGFTEHMYELMNMADLVIGKAGPATVMEVLILQKPLVLTSYMFGQEKGNVEFVVRNRLGFFARSPEGIRAIVDRILTSPLQQRELQKRIAAMEIKNGTDPIARYIPGYSSDTPRAV